MDDYAAGADVPDGSSCAATSTTRDAEPCGICDNCTGTSLAVDLRAGGGASDAVEYLRSADLAIEPRKQLPDRSRDPAGRRPETGRALAVWGDGGWGGLVREGREARAAASTTSSCGARPS